MESDSFENFGRYKNIINEEVNNFKSNFEDAPKIIKQHVHFQSVINLSREIIRFNNSEANAQKKLMLEYFTEIKNTDFSYLDKDIQVINEKRIESINRYQKYLSPIGTYLVYNSGNVKSKLPFGCYILFGIILDTIIYFFFNRATVPFATIVFIIIGFLFRNNKENADKTFAPFN